MTGPAGWIAVWFLAFASLYLLFGGADFGAGIWHLFACGPRKEDQRRLAASSIKPVWAQNHIFIAAALIAFVAGFPKGAPRVASGLSILLPLFGLALIARGAAFSIHSGTHFVETAKRRSGRLFGIGSLAAPFVTGVIAGTLSAGGFPASGGAAWWLSFPLISGLLVVSLSAFLSACFLLMETDDPALKDDFRVRAIASSLAVAVLLVAAAVAAHRDAPLFYKAFLNDDAALSVLIVCAGCAVAAFTSLLLRADGLARAMAAAQALSVAAGWGVAQNPYLVRPDITLAQAAAPDDTLVPLAWIFSAGSIALLAVYGRMLWRTKKKVL